MDDAKWKHAVFSKNHDGLLTPEVAQRFFAEVKQRAERFMSDDHFTVHGTLIQAWALPLVENGNGLIVAAMATRERLR